MKTRKLVQFAMLLALSVVGSYIKIPSFVGSLALDAVPGYFAALCISPLLGAAVAAGGHVITAVVSGVPFGLPIHAMIALGMAAAAYCTGVLARRSSILGAAAGIALNGVGLPALFILIPAYGLPFFMAATPLILLASLLNVVIATMLSSVPQIKKMTYGQ